jgi:cation transport ATPase
MVNLMKVKRSLRLPINDLDCPAAAAIIEHALASTAGVLHAYVNAATETAYIEYEATATDPRTLALAIGRAGYKSGPPVAA